MAIPYSFTSSDLFAQARPDGYDRLSAVEKDATRLHIATALIPYVRDGTIYFPYHRLISLPPRTLFSNLQKITLKTKAEPYRLYSYYPKYNSYLPPKFRDGYLTIHSTASTYEQANVLSDYFIEDVRLQGKRYDQDLSTLGCWENDECLTRILKNALEKKEINPVNMRQVVFETIPETKVFNPTWARALIHSVMGTNVARKKWLDISSGWGDRLLAAMSLDMDYVGFDPNTNLKKGHSEMIAMFGDKSRHQVIYEPFEKGTIPAGPYDVVLTSPPYFDLEEYAPGQEGQSIVSYSGYTRWMVWFMFAALEKAWKNLAIGGYLILHLGDAKTIVIVEPTNIFIENYLPGASWEGVIGVAGDKGYPRPVWVWKKVDARGPRRIWDMTTSSERTLLKMYPELHHELIRFYVNKYAPYYTRRRKNADIIRMYVQQGRPDLTIENITSVYSDLVITSLIEVQEIDDAIATLVTGLQTYPIVNVGSITENMPSYNIRIQNGVTIRAQVAQKLPVLSKDNIAVVLTDDILASLLEQLGLDNTILWAVSILELTYKL